MVLSSAGESVWLVALSLVGAASHHAVEYPIDARPWGGTLRNGEREIFARTGRVGIAWAVGASCKHVVGPVGAVGGGPR